MAVAPAAARTRNRTRSRRIVSILAWSVAAFALLVGLEMALDMHAFPHALSRDPVVTKAVVTDSFINGMGGDPAVDYRYVVNSRTYTGWGTGDGVDHPDLLSVRKGAAIEIRYARSVPSQFCFCEPSSESATVGGYLFSALLVLPLPLLIIRYLSRRRRRGSRRRVAHTSAAVALVIR
jgi:hypothetical protein